MSRWRTPHAHGHRNGPTVLNLVPFMCGFILLVQALVLDIMATPD